MTEQNRVRVLIISEDKTRTVPIAAYLADDPEFELVGIEDTGQGKDGITKVIQLRPNVAILDPNLYDMNVIQLTESIKKAVPATKIIGMFASLDSGYVREWFGAGARIFLSVPFDRDELIHAIRLACQE